MAPNFRLKLILTIIRYYTTYHLFKYGSKGIMWDSNFFSLHSHPQLQLQKFRNLAWPQILLELIRAWNPAHSKGGLSIWGRRSSIRWRANSKITSISLCGFFSYFFCISFLGFRRVSAYFVVILSMTEIGLSGFVCSLSIYLFRICSLE